jgi:hypothetical protein
VSIAVGIGIGRAVDAVGTSYMWWILAAAASTLDSILAVGSETMDVATTLGPLAGGLLMPRGKSPLLCGLPVAGGSGQV